MAEQEDDLRPHNIQTYEYVGSTLPPVVFLAVRNENESTLSIFGVPTPIKLKQMAIIL